ncbi:hypothetical protein [Arsenophonus nasoniae]|uniref:Uncharacterized protein n=1 Tax=Arsenophonus nasoniae TaxID=638 RepID=A0AA95GRS3_9GAMM|nr:hypothetical protein [Arsenophonus nasoniae]WGM04098.1 hypothetical protein QE210_21815 [Arsenophonus nasoniae]
MALMGEKLKFLGRGENLNMAVNHQKQTYLSFEVYKNKNNNINNLKFIVKPVFVNCTLFYGYYKCI